jgi:hypothetical protein
MQGTNLDDFLQEVQALVFRPRNAREPGAS